MSPTTLAIPSWQPPLTAEELGRVLEKMRTWQPLRLAAIFDDLDQVLGEQRPATDDLYEIGDRLRGALVRLGSIAIADPGHRPGTETLVLVEHGHALRDEDMSGTYWQNLGLARRMAWTISDLIERMIDERHIKDDD